MELAKTPFVLADDNESANLWKLATRIVPDARWQLRGVISARLVSINHFSCSVNARRYVAYKPCLGSVGVRIHTSDWEWILRQQYSTQRMEGSTLLDLAHLFVTENFCLSTLIGPTSVYTAAASAPILEGTGQHIHINGERFALCSVLIHSTLTPMDGYLPEVR